MGFMLKKCNSKRRKGRGKAASLIPMAAVATALTLLPIPMETSAVEEREGTGGETGAIASEALQEPEATRELEQETSAEEGTQPASVAASEEALETLEEAGQEAGKETEKETEPASTAAQTESKPLKETEQETSVKEETESKPLKESEQETDEKKETESEPLEESEEGTSEKKETEPVPATVPQEPESPGKEEIEGSGKGEKDPTEREIDSSKVIRKAVPSAVEIKVPIYKYDVVNIVAPTKYAVALNPYGLAVRTGEDEVSTGQVVSRKYGILNKSSTDKIVSVTFMVEDLNGGKIVFVDSEEEAWEADEDTYAVYLAAVPADDSGIWINGEPVDCDTTAAELSDVEMEEATDSALPLGEGKNTLSFLLSKAVYSFGDGTEHNLGEEDWEYEDRLELLSLAPGEGGITAFTFTGAMNPKADWGKLLYGIKISAVYTYKTATGEEEILEGTGAMIMEE